MEQTACHGSGAGPRETHHVLSTRAVVDGNSRIFVGDAFDMHVDIHHMRTLTRRSKPGRLGPSWTKGGSVRSTRFFGDGATVVSLLFLSGDFPLRRFSFVESDGLHQCLPREVIERDSGDDQPE